MCDSFLRIAYSYMQLNANLVQHVMTFLLSEKATREVRLPETMTCVRQRMNVLMLISCCVAMIDLFFVATFEQNMIYLVRSDHNGDHADYSLG